MKKPSRPRKEKRDAKKRADALSLAANAAETLDSVLQKLDGKVLREIGAIAALIRNLRKEIAAIERGKSRGHGIPAAGKELEAVVSATESASHRILECAEDVMAADMRDPVRYKALVDARMTSIFEACEFQDLTGQRIGKIIATLKQIEARVAQFADAPGMKAAKPKSGNSQDAIDRLLAKRRRR